MGVPSLSEWTEGRKKSFIVSTLRAGNRRWPPRYNTLNAAKTEKRINVSTGRLAQHYECAECLEEFPAKVVQVDHIKPVVDPKKGFISWDVFIDRMFCDEDNLQVLCKACHLKKSEEERAQRTECNRGIGLLRDDADLLRTAAAYLDSHTKKTTKEREVKKNARKQKL